MSQNTKQQKYSLFSFLRGRKRLNLRFVSMLGILNLTALMSTFKISHLMRIKCINLMERGRGNLYHKLFIGNHRKQILWLWSTWSWVIPKIFEIVLTAPCVTFFIKSWSKEIYDSQNWVVSVLNPDELDSSSLCLILEALDLSYWKWAILKSLTC